MRDRGAGSVYLRPGSRFYQIKFSKDGRVYRESTGTDKITAGKAILQQRLNELDRGTYNPQSKRVTVAELIEFVLRDYEIKGHKSLDDAKARWALHLEPVFGNHIAVQVTSDAIEKYKLHRLEENARPATINRELALLKRAFQFGMRATPPKVQRMPYFDMLRENNVRKGFVEGDQYTKLAQASAKQGLWMRALFECGYLFGWRVGELLSMKVRQVDLQNREVRLEPGTTKNEEGRTAAMTDGVLQLLKACISDKQSDDYVFTREGGRPVRDFRGTWEAVTAEAGMPGLLFHDLRRTAVRNMVRSGVPETVAMKISGHKTRSVFDRYNVTSAADLRDAARRLELAGGAQKPETVAVEAQPLGMSTQFGTQSKTLPS